MTRLWTMKGNDKLPSLTWMETGHDTHNKSSQFKGGRTRDLVHTALITTCFLIVEKMSTELSFLSFIILEGLSLCFSSKVGSGGRFCSSCLIFVLLKWFSKGRSHTWQNACSRHTHFLHWDLQQASEVGCVPSLLSEDWGSERSCPQPSSGCGRGWGAWLQALCLLKGPVCPWMPALNLNKFVSIHLNI